MGTLYVVSTPIGNLEDITIRAIKILLSVDVILCEDTRRTGLLLQQLKKHASFLEGSLEGSHPSEADQINVHARSLEGSHPSIERGKKQRGEIVRFDEHTEKQIIPEIIGHLLQGKSVALVSDAGTPLINDPGFLLVQECLKRNINVISIPGPSAVLTALTSSGLPTNHFVFLGYPPEKQSHRRTLFNNVSLIHQSIDSTFVFYCAPHKLEGTLKDLQHALGDIHIVICRELTKVHEEVWRGKISEAIVHFARSKGEIVLVFRLLT